MCGGGGTPPQDNSAEVARIEAEEARRAREERQRQEEAARAQFENRLSSAYTTAVDNASNYFAAQGLDPADYISDITSSAQSARSRVPDLDASPGTYFENLGASVYDRLEDAQRSRAQRNFDTFASDGFATRRIGSDVDDPFLEAILAEQQAAADDYARRLLDRGIVTQGGYDAAIEDIVGQRAGANARLQDIGLAELERGRGSLRDIAATGRSAASRSRLGDAFDPFQYQRDIDSAQADFFSGLGENLRASAPEDLFDIDGLLGIAGAAQGAQNTEFDPNALSSIFDEEDDDEEDDEDEDDDAFADIF